MTTTWKNQTPPTAPFYAVIFISRKGENLEGYEEMDVRMMELAQQQEGYLGYSSVSKPDGGIFISYWQDEESIQKWRIDSRHGEAKGKAKDWYAYYHSMISKVESSYIFGEQL
ncbi:antibiotic biosynthesis monooxygenase family protein [Owenweeksia hongkongensis]|uniref:antibiotic biosynthesis monooxygenase family protein n=1 Tax=Owenweeksia hongkongensis TaxID=253245 RepID=UPI003A8CC3EF